MSGADAGAITEHRELVREMSRPGGPLAPDAPTSSMRNPDWFYQDTPVPEPTLERGYLHRRLLTEHLAKFPDARADRQAIVLAGPPGAGKSSVLHRLLEDDLPGWVVVDADEFKHALLTQAIADGTYDTKIVPDIVRQAQEAGERFAPLELASLVHEESSLLAARARTAALRGGLNVVVDTVLSGERSARVLGGQLEQAGYRVRVVDVETTYEISAARVEQRWRDVTRAYLADQNDTGLGGRWVPSEYTRGLFPAELHGKSVCEGIARTLAEGCGAVDQLAVYRVTDPQSAPRLEATYERPRRGAPIVDAETARSLRTMDRTRGARRASRPGDMER